MVEFCVRKDLLVRRYTSRLLFLTVVSRVILEAKKGCSFVFMRSSK